MNHLFKFSTFEGGNLSLTMQGDFEHFNGLIKVDNTKIKDYTVLNNTLAFFNTIPALVTFSVPGYSSKGLKVSEMYTNFEVNKDHVTIKDTKISSKELTITAKGESDLKKENIDLLMEVKTDIGSSAKNIPLLGYIIFGDDTVSTTVRVHGDLKDPKVENSVAKSIIVAPYNIIKRTITLPFKVFDIFDDKNASR
jgi:AsmA-like protein